MRKLILILSAVFVFVLNAAAQNRTISGKVTDEKGAAIEGVTVTSSDGKQGTQTGKDGTYSISVPASVKSLNFSNVNFEAQSKTIGNQLTINVTLRPRDSKLEEVVVVGYGTQRKREFTGSLASIKGTAVADKPVQSFDQALAGRVTGVQVQIPNGVLNTPPVFRIRGTSSISLSSYPLVVVDGIPTPTGDFSSTNAAGNALASINPNDIESIDVAKDAAATAIYGSRAANGVVYITTKKGKAGKTRINYNASFGFTSAYGIPEVMNAQQWTDFKNMAATNNQNLNTTNPAGANYTKFALTNGPDGKPIDTRWADIIYRQGFNQDHNLNVSGANETTSYYFSGGYSRQEGILRTNDFTRKNILMNVDSRFNKRITIGGKISYSNELNRINASSGSLNGEAFGTAGVGRLQFVTSPNVSPYKNDGTYNISTAGNFIGGMNNSIAQVGFYNPVVMFDRNRSNSETNHIQSNVYIQFKPFSWLTLKSAYGIDYLFVDNEIFQTPLHGDGFAAVGNASSTLGKYKRWTWSNTAQFDYVFRQKHSVSALVGQEQDRRTSTGFGINRQQVSDPVYTVIQAGWGINNSTGSVYGENYLTSVFGRIRYDFNKKYFASVNLRQDEYSALPFQKETFWGVSAGWNLNNEKFWNVMKNVFSSFRLTGSYGKVGNTGGIGDYASYSTYGSGLYGGLPTLVFNQAGNNLLKWETSYKLDVGVNFGILNERITVEASYFKNNISNLILNVPQAPSAGLPTSVPSNVGKMINKGIEISTNIVPVQRKNFAWTVNFNYTNIANQVTELAPGLAEVLTSTSGLETVNRTAVGYSVGSLWLVRSAGVDPATGSRVLLNSIGNRVLYRFAPGPGQFNWSNPDGTRYNKADGSANTINQTADAYMHNALPKFYGGLSNNFRYKNFDLDILVTYQGGNYVYYGSWAGLHDMRFWNNHVDVLNAWKKFGDESSVPRPVYGDNVSNGSALPMTYSLFKGDFIKLKNMTLGYNLPQELISKARINSARFFVSGQNLFIFTDYPGPDPEVSSNGNTPSSPGVDRNTIANGRTFTVGINIGF
ncbi:MAG: SusC/RagA family TonB-linked outer membrane protein [Chitinophagaceae bacterium]|nr:SusC/RagA family TonB-linked outer membrane protein [Chitinophagaceae bacterium]